MVAGRLTADDWPTALELRAASNMNSTEDSALVGGLPEFLEALWANVEINKAVVNNHADILDSFGTPASGGFTGGLDADKDTPSAVTGQLYLATDKAGGRLYGSTGFAWVTLAENVMAVAKIQTPTWASSVTLDPSLGSVALMTLAGNTALGINNTLGVQGQELTVILVQDATGGRTVTWDPSKFAPAPTVALTATAVTVSKFIYTGFNWVLSGGTVGTIDTDGGGSSAASSVHGLVVRGHSWAAEHTAFGTNVGQNLDRWWPQMLRKRFGFEDFRYRVSGTDYQTALGVNSAQPFREPGTFPPVEGHITSVYMRLRSDGVGTGVHYRTWRMFTSRGFSVTAQPIAQLVGQSLTITKNTNQIVPFDDITKFEQQRIVPGDGFIIAANVSSGATPADDGQVWSVAINGGQYSNHSRNGSMYCQAGNQGGGWGEQNIWESLRIRGAGAPVADQTGHWAPSKATSRLPVYTSPQNEFGAGIDKACMQEVLRQMWSIDKAMYLWAANDASMTYNNGSVAASPGWATVAGPTGSLGVSQNLQGTIGATKPYFEVAVPAAMKAGTPVALGFLSHPSRVVTGIGTTNGNANLTAPVGTFFTPDDVGLPISGTGIPTGARIATVVASTSATLNTNATGSGTITATIGFAGATATITIDGAAPNFAGTVRINNGTSDQVNTHMVTGFNGNGRVGITQPEPANNQRVRIIPICKVITGLPESPTGHTIRVTVDSYGSGPEPWFYSNGWWMEAMFPTPPIVMHKQPVLLATAAVYAVTMHGVTGAANIATRNGWLTELADEFNATGRGNIVFVDLETILAQNPAYFSDASHPGPLGHQRIEEATWAAIQSISSAVLAAA